ncbi:MAG: DegT/DnrJ/EryC1/StrS family aminotransferase [Candidatus Binatia bacterium]|nr:DegT/DnrJ/EryC1/StrS family aminotransferase [Candidatus Binatia bacterium]
MGGSIHVPLLDLKREYESIRSELAAEWERVLQRMHLLKGENVSAFEEEIARFVGTTHAIGVASGTDALLLTVRALGIGPGDEVILHANAFVAALEAVHHNGATPVLVDAAGDDFGPDVEQVAQAITPRTKAVIAVHLYGFPLRLEPLVALCRQRRLFLIEDCSHAHGARWRGRHVGSFGLAGCFSAGVVKNLGAYGDAGFLTTDDSALAAKVRLLQAHGQARKNEHQLYGFNSRLDELQAAVLRVKLRYLEQRNARRRAIASFYRDQFRDLPLIVPAEPEEGVSVYHQFVVQTAQRDELQRHLKAAGVDTGVHYPVPLHRQPAWEACYFGNYNFPRAETYAAELLSIPVFPDLSDPEVEHVATAVRKFFLR